MNLTGDLLWCRPFGARFWSPIVEFMVNRSFCLRLAVIAALAAALPLAACGRKGPLDPPPGGMMLEKSPGMADVSRRGAPPPPAAGPAYDENGQPIAPEGPRRPMPMDWLLN
jgi:hypothetical protein